MDRTVKSKPVAAMSREELERFLKSRAGRETFPRAPRQPGENRFPLSFAQQRVWFLEQLAPGTSQYNLPLALRLSGRLNLPALQQSLEELARRHEILRTTLENRDGEPVQVVHAGLAPWFTCFDIRSFDSAQKEDIARDWAVQEILAPFDLVSGPLWRTCLFQLEEDEFLLAFAIHHLIFDGWSTSVFLQELAQLYEHFSAGQVSLPPEPALQYGDYAAWQRERLEGEKSQASLAYWREKLSGAPQSLDLPAAIHQGGEKSFQGKMFPFSLDPVLAARLRAFCRKESLTPFMLLFAAFQVLLYRYTRQPVFLVGSPIANRPLLELEKQIGFFVNTLALKCDLSGSPTFRELAQQVRRDLLEAYEHQELPFEKLVEELDPERRADQSPLFQVLFALQNLSPDSLRFAGLSSRLVGLDLGRAKLDLEMHVWDLDQEIQVFINYPTGLFQPALVERMAGHFQNLVRGALDYPDRAAAGLPMLDDGERSRILGEWSRGEPAPPGLPFVHRQFELQAETTPEACALAGPENCWTYRELDARSNRLAHLLQAVGIGPEKVAGVLLPPSPEMIQGILGAWKAGGAYLAIDPDYPAERIAVLLEAAEVAVLVTSRALLDRLPPGCEIPTICLDTDSARILEQPAWAPDAGLSPDHLAYLIFTSGSTGQPKAVMLTHRGAANLADAQRARITVGPGDRVLQFSSFNFDAHVWELLMALTNGAALHLIDPALKASPDYLAQVFQAERITHATLPPSVLALLPEVLFPDLKYIFAAGEPCTPDLAERFAAPYRFFNAYGPTETTVCVAMERVLPGESGLIPIGRPLANTRLYVLDERMQPQPPGAAGELHAGGAGLARGYKGQPEQTVRQFVADPFSDEPEARLYKTGDLARFRDDGRLEFLGRIDAQLKIRGYRIEPGEIEAALNGHPGVRASAVVSVSRGGGPAQQLAAFFIPGGQPPLSPAELRRFLQEKLPDYMIPSAFQAIEALPLTSSGKVDRRALSSLAAALPPESGTSGRPRTIVEETLAVIWEDVLGVPGVGVEADFFELGGHSLRATRVASRIRSAFKVDLPLRKIFETPTIAGLARQVEALIRDEGPGSVLPGLQTGRRTGPLPLSFSQSRLWFLHQLEPGSPAYNMPVALRIRGALDREALQAGLDFLARRHESLRTSFHSEDGKPIQVIAPEIRVEIAFSDFSKMAPAAAAEAGRKMLSREAWAPFDLTSPPLFRASLVRVGAGEHILLLVVHHILSDGWSMGLLFDELLQAYSAFQAGAMPALPDLEVQYADFAIWQRGWLQGDRLEKLLAYWKRQLEDLPVLALPSGRRAGQDPGYRAQTLTFKIPAESLDRVRSLARQETASLYMVLLAAFQVLLFRYTGQGDLAIGTPIANRNFSEIERIVGFFVNSLVVRTQVSGDQNFLEVVRTVRETLLEAYAHQDLPFEKLVEELHPARDARNNPLFQVAFAFQNTPFPPLQAAGLDLALEELSEARVRVDLEVHLWEEAGGVCGSFIYKSDRFDPAFAAQMAGHYLNLLGSATAAPENKVASLSLLADEERHLILEAWNDTDRDLPFPTFLDLFDRQVKANPHSPALVFEGTQLSYEELDFRANRLANALVRLGAGREQVVATCLDLPVDSVVSFLAILKAGAVYLPLAANFPAERLRYMVRDAGAEFLVSGAGLKDLFTDLPLRILDPGGPEVEAASSEKPAVRIGPGDLAYLIYTSGSTGLPKGVQLSHQGLANVGLAQQEILQVRPQDRVLQFFSHSFDGSIFEFCLALGAGASLYLARREDLLPGQALVRFLQENGIGVATFPPSILALLPPSGLPGLHTVMSAGESCPPELAASWGENRRFFNLYGPTEATIWSTFWVYDGPPDRSLIGRPVRNTRVFLLDEALQPVPIGAVGEIWIGGAGLARGYQNRPELTAERFIPDPFSRKPGSRLYRTGDLARFRPDGRLEFLGRADRQVKLRGFRIELDEVEAVLNGHPAVRQGAVQLRSLPAGEKVLAAYLALEPEEAVESGGVSQLAQEQVVYWQQVYDGLYGQDGEENPFRGWNSSYTGRPIPAGEMQAWLDATVGRIEELGPRRVLEIGCGSGLLLFRLAPGCACYWATDFSKPVIDRLRQKLALRSLPQVSVFPLPADDFSPFEGLKFDTIILNSVIQYFPDLGYLLRVIRKAAAALEPGGRIFIGDVRSYDLLEAFHQSVELFQAPDELPLAELGRRVGRRLAQEQELAVAPAFFHQLPGLVPELSHAAVELKRGEHQNEISKFRYDVVLAAGPRPEAPPPEAVDWSGENRTLDWLRRTLETARPPVLHLRRIPNRRLEQESFFREALRTAGPERLVGDLKQAWKENPPQGGVDPEALRALGGECGYAVRAGWGASGQPEHFEAWLALPGRAGDLPVLSQARPAGTGQTPAPALANQPLRARREHQAVESIRNGLRQRLPDPMVPTAWIVLDRLPALPNEKLDRSALPEPEYGRPEARQSASEPRTPLEKTLAAIWSSVLKVDQVGIHDNFFDLGGDSILSIQIISRANEAGIRMTARQLYQHSTIAGLSAVVSPAERRVEAAAPEDREVPLTPIQRWFFDQELDEPWHWNQSLLLEMAPGTAPEEASRVLAQWAEGQPALRLRFRRAESGWQQTLAEAGGIDFSLVELEAGADGIDPALLEREAGRVQRSLDLEKGPLFRAVWLRPAAPAGPQYLLLVAHHLVFDGVSWRILLEGLQRGLEQARRGEPPAVSGCRTSYPEWSRRLQEYARSGALHAESGGWVQQLKRTVPRLPVDFEGETPNTVARAGQVSALLDEAGTRALFSAAQAHQASLGEVLIAALAQTLGEWTGSPRVRFDLEGHGREELFEGVDLTRTVGWFTTLYPVTIDLPGTGELAAALQKVKDQVRKVPKSGLGYLALRYLSGPAEASRELGEAPRSEVLFNYLGQFKDPAQEMSFFKPAGLSSGPTRSERGTRPYLLEISASIYDDRLHVDWFYPTGSYRRDTLERLSGRFLEATRGLAGGSENTQPAPSTADFPLADLDARQLQKLAGLIQQKDRQKRR